jgi:uncharacterized membrane protein YoaK (UPF0700 family)
MEPENLAAPVGSAVADASRASGADPAAAARDERRFRIASSLLVPAVLSFVAGFVDVTCYVGLFQTFTAFITGNIIVLVAKIAEGHVDIWTKVLVVPAFLLAAAVWIEMIKRLRATGRDVIIHILVLVEAALIALFMLTGALLAPLPSADAWQTMLTAFLSVSAMALQNVTMVLVLHFHAPTTVMTGNITNLAVHQLNATSAFRYRIGAPPKLSRGALIRRYGIAIASFIAGAALGGYGYSTAGFWALAAPAAALSALGVGITVIGWLGPRAGRAT